MLAEEGPTSPRPLPLKVAGAPSDEGRMQLTTETPDLEAGAQHVARASFVPPLLATLGGFGFVAGGAVALWRLAGEVPGVLWVVLGPLALVTGPLMLLVAFAFLDTFRSSLRATNWLACVRVDGVFLNLRSYRNGHFEGDDPTVCFLDFGELASVGRVVEVRTEAHRDRPLEVRTVWIELACRSAAATEELEIACFLERTREAPTTERLGVRSRTKHHHVPVYVPAPGRVRVEWDRKLFDALARELEVVPERRVDLDAAFEPLAVEARARELLCRGQRMGAARVLREAGWEHDLVKAWIEGERSRRAA